MSLNILEAKFTKLASHIDKDYSVKKFIDDVNSLIKEVHDMKSPTFKFGKKHKGKTVVQVFEEDPKYISYYSIKTGLRTGMRYMKKSSD